MCQVIVQSPSKFDLVTVFLLSLLFLLCYNSRVDSYKQTASYPKYAYGHGLIDITTKKWLEKELDACMVAIEGTEVCGWKLHCYHGRPDCALIG